MKNKKQRMITGMLIKNMEMNDEGTEFLHHDAGINDVKYKDGYESYKDLVFDFVTDVNLGPEVRATGLHFLAGDHALVRDYPISLIVVHPIHGTGELRGNVLITNVDKEGNDQDITQEQRDWLGDHLDMTMYKDELVFRITL